MKNLKRLKEILREQWARSNAQNDGENIGSLGEGAVAKGD